MLNSVNIHSEKKHADANAPIGVFDSGIGGLSVARHLRAQLPNEQFIYVADSGYAPYGERSNDELIERSIKITDFFLGLGIKALVIACNTATAAAVKTLRERHPDLIIIGIEPGIKPAAMRSESKIVGVLATKSTLSSDKFKQLSERLSRETHTQFIPQACVGLVNQIELGDLHSEQILELLRLYVCPLLDKGVDTLVLGCTHYPFVAPQINQVINEFFAPQKKEIHIIDNGEAVARRLTQLLLQENLLCDHQQSALIAYTTGKLETLVCALNFDSQNNKLPEAYQIQI